ncbi:hypothetical protein [Halobacterium wangiae]|uniref:hypothetical protein n=1 Tax=Halobacterium wangiae TaxID=2902623 RepID=UPI001E364D80|nr:hypothetical protein [Halobacterium wangiae]
MNIPSSVINLGRELATQVGSAFIATIPIILGGYYLYEHRQKVRARRLRHALLTEIEAIQPELMSVMEEGDAYLDDPVFQGNLDKIDLLTNEEINAVIRFYSRLSPLRQRVSREGPAIEPENIPSHLTNNAMSCKEDAIEELEKQISSQPTVRKPRSDSYSSSDPRD